MLPSRVVCNLPPWVNNRPVPDFHDAIAGIESGRHSSLDHFDVSPLIPVVVNVVGNFAEKYALWPEDSMCLFGEGPVEMGKVVSVLR